MVILINVCNMVLLAVLEIWSLACERYGKSEAFKYLDSTVSGPSQTSSDRLLVSLGCN